MRFIEKYQQLFVSLVFTCFLIGFRSILSGTPTFLFLVWNLFLAVLPLLFSYKLAGSSRLKACLYGLLWLLFFPNAMYIVTDLFHLHPRPHIPFWFDLLILFSAALNGLIAGFISLYNTEKWLSQTWKSRSRHAFPLLAMFLCGYGIYLGRYERWNSWDVVARPFSLLSDMANHFLHPLQNKHCWLITILFGFWMYIIYGFIRSVLVRRA